MFAKIAKIADNPMLATLNCPLMSREYSNAHNDTP